MVFGVGVFVMGAYGRLNVSDRGHEVHSMNDTGNNIAQCGVSGKATPNLYLPSSLLLST